MKKMPTLSIHRFQLYYYANGEFKKDERKETILTIDTRWKIWFFMYNRFEVDWGGGKSMCVCVCIKTYKILDKNFNGKVPRNLNIYIFLKVAIPKEYYVTTCYTFLY